MVWLAVAMAPVLVLRLSPRLLHQKQTARAYTGMAAAVLGLALALGVGGASIRSDRNAESDSFGLVGLCSIGPILAVLILGFVYESDTTGVGA